MYRRVLLKIHKAWFVVGMVALALSGCLAHPEQTMMQKLALMPHLSIEPTQTMVFDGSLYNCTNLKNHKDNIIADSSWVIYRHKKLLASAREMVFSDNQTALTVYRDSKKIADIFYKAPRASEKWTNCWPEHWDRFYLVLRNDNRVLMIGDANLHEYGFTDG